MEQNILVQLQELYEKQDMLSRLTDHVLYSDTGLSELHCLAAITRLSEPNSTQIAAHLKMTRGAVSKIIKKLADKKLIEVFQKPDNKKEKYFRLTKQGDDADQRHTKAHYAWEQRDSQFLQSIPDSEMRIVSSFLTRFNHYLEQIIEEKTI